MRKGQRVILYNEKLGLVTEARVDSLTESGEVATVETPNGDFVQVLNTSFKVITLLQAILQLFINFFKK